MLGNFLNDLELF